MNSREVSLRQSFSGRQLSIIIQPPKPLAKNPNLDLNSEENSALGKTHSPSQTLIKLSTLGPQVSLD